MPMPEQDDNESNNFRTHMNKKSALKGLNIEDNYRCLVGESLDIRSRAKNMLLRRTPQDRLLKSELLLFFKEVKTSDQEFAAGILVFYIKYNNPGL